MLEEESEVGFYGIVVLCVVIVLATPALLMLVYYSWRNGISPMPASAPIRRTISEQVGVAAKRIIQLQQEQSDTITQASHQPNQYSHHPLQVIEAGSGWGTLALHIIQNNPNICMVGIENSPLPLCCSRVLSRWKRTNIQFQQGDIYLYPYEQADIVVCYLFPGAMRKLRPILEQRCRPHTYVISACFAVPEWEPEQVILCSDWYHTPVYVYRCGHRSYLA